MKYPDRMTRHRNNQEMFQDQRLDHHVQQGEWIECQKKTDVTRSSHTE